MTALETRTVAGLTSDPDSNVLIDALMASGLVRHIDVWTDEEAERCRLAAFWPRLRDHTKGPWSEASHVLRADDDCVDGGRDWVWGVTGVNGYCCTRERRPGAFDAPEHALGVLVEPEVERVMRRGRRLPLRFRARGPRGAKKGPVLPWHELLPSLRRGGYLPADEVRR